MDNLYNWNGLIFWSEEEIQARQMLQDFFVAQLTIALKQQNSAFEMVRVEAPLLTPGSFINKNYSSQDYFTCERVPGEWLRNDSEKLVLRPETTMGSYAYAKHLLNPHGPRKYRMPLVVWQHGKSFRKEQDQSTKFMRLKEFYQLEFQIIYSPSTANDYSTAIVPAVQAMISKMIGPCRTEPSDRLPDYSESTTDIVHEGSNMEVCSISKRKDFEGAKVLEVAIGTDRCVYHFLDRSKEKVD